MKLDLKHAQAGGTPELDLPQNTTPLIAAEAADLPLVTDDASSATSSEESFERVSAADLAEYEATAAEAKPSPADAVPDQGDEGCAALDPAKTSSADEMLCQ